MATWKRFVKTSQLPTNANLHPAGSGKSVLRYGNIVFEQLLTNTSSLSSTVIEYLENSYGDDPRVALGYFYFSFDDSKKQDTVAMLRSLIKQLCLQRRDIPESVKNLMTKYKDMDRDPTVAILERTATATMEDFEATFIVIDALDECPTDRRKMLLNSLCRILNSISDNVHLLCTSRKERDIEDAFDYLWAEPSKAAVDLSLHKQEVDADIGLHINQELSDWTYKRWPAEIKAEVTAALIDKADGM